MCRLWVIWLWVALLGACVGPHDPRAALVAATLVRADQALLLGRPSLLAARYAAMGQSAFAFYRGTISVWRRDWRDAALGLSASRFGLDHPMPLGAGDPHPENFGLLDPGDGPLRFELNDLDAVERVPYLWDLRRLLVGLVLAVRGANADDAAARSTGRAAEGAVVEAALGAYLATLRGQGPEAVTEAPESPVLADLFRRGARDRARRAELDALTELVAGRRALRRGAFDREDPQSALASLPPFARASLPSSLAAMRASLSAPTPAAWWALRDAARLYGSGVASLARVRVLVLLEGPSESPDDDVLLEVKELSDALTPGFVSVDVAATSLPSRITAAAAGVWSAPGLERYWGAATWLGFAVQCRVERASQKSVRVARLVGALGSVAALEALGADLGAALGRIHRRGEHDGRVVGAAIAARITDPAGFIAEQRDIATRYASQVEADHAAFVLQLRAAGPRLGFAPATDCAPDPDLAALVGDAP